MKSVLLLVMVVVGASAFADLIPFEIIRPTPLHRIGIDILAEVVGALAVGGLALKRLVAKYEKVNKSEVLEIEKERERKSRLSGDSTIVGGGDFVRVEELEGSHEGAAFEVPHASRWRELGAEERQTLESKLDKEMRLFESAYDQVSGEWLREVDLPNQWTSKRGEWWGQKCKELVFSVLLQDAELRGRLKGVPIEWVLSRMDRPTKRTWREWALWQMDSLFVELGKFPDEVLDFFAGVGSSEIRRCMQEHRGSEPVWCREKMQDVRKKVRRWMCRILLLVYLVGVIAMVSGVVGVEASCATAKVVKAVFLSFLPVIGAIAILFVFWVVWKTVLSPLNRWRQGAKLKRISEKRGKLFDEYRGEREWRISVFDITPSRQQMQLLSNGGVVMAVGGAKDASLKLKYPGVARHHAEIYFDKSYYALGGCGFVMRGVGCHGVCCHVVDRLPKKEKDVCLNAGCEICVGPYAILKVVSVPSEEENAFVFELVDGRRNC